MITLNIYKSDIEKTLKMSRLRVFWSTQACTILASQNSIEDVSVEIN